MIVNKTWRIIKTDKKNILDKIFSDSEFIQCIIKSTECLDKEIDYYIENSIMVNTDYSLNIKDDSIDDIRNIIKDSLKETSGILGEINDPNRIRGQTKN